MSSPGGLPAPEAAIDEGQIYAEYERLVPDENVRRLFNEAGVGRNVQGIIGRLNRPQNPTTTKQDIDYLNQQLNSGFDRINTSATLDDVRREQARNAFFTFATETSINGRESIHELTVKHAFQEELKLSDEDMARYYPVAKEIFEKFDKREPLAEEEMEELKNILFTSGVRKSHADWILGRYTSINQDQRESVTNGLLERREEEIAEESSLQAEAEKIAEDAKVKEDEAEEVLRGMQDGPMKTKLQEARDTFRAYLLRADELGLTNAVRGGGRTAYYLLVLAWVAFIGVLTLANKGAGGGKK